MTQAQQQQHHDGLCCWYLKYGKCEPPRPPCRFRHEPDNGTSPCCFGATCRLGHAKRVVSPRTESEKLEYWRNYNNNDQATIGSSPAMRDATLIRSQLEPWSTAVLRERLATVFGENHRDLDPLGRGEIMRRLLKHYENHGPRRIIKVNGTPVRSTLRAELSEELKKWRARHSTNTRPSIRAKSYMILRSPAEFNLKDSKKSKMAAKKLAQNSKLWELAQTAITEIDADFAQNFSALAVTYGFQGSPHIDKQNTGPFYGMALGNFRKGQGGIFVEASPLLVAHVNTRNRLGKVDGRYPHWVAPYDEGAERYSLIFYSTWQTYEQPQQAFFDNVVDD